MSAGVGATTAPKGARLLVVQQTATVPASGTARLTQPHRWEDDRPIELLYGIITSGTLTSLTIDLKTGSNESISGGNKIPLECFVFSSPPERPDANVIGIIRRKGEAQFEPELADESGSQQSVTINWFFRILDK